VTERIQKVLAAAGLASRRTVDAWLAAGRIQVNGRTVGPGDRAAPGDVITVDGQVVVHHAAPVAQPPGILIYHKPLGEVTTRHDPQGRPTVFDRLPAAPAGQRWVVVGRLDVNTTGLLVFTTDGALAHRMMHPSFEMSREYLVRLRGHPGPETVRRVLGGVMLDDGPARFDAAQPAGNSEGHSWMRVRLHEGRNREVRRLWEAVGHEVSRLKRLAHGPFLLPDDLPPGRARLLTAAEAAVALQHLPRVPSSPG
jgi:23S rRNA pseudouridine2605 synthase